MIDQGVISVTELAVKPVPKNKLILSLFPGIDLFSKPFEAAGFCVVRGPDILLGQDIRDFHVPEGVFSGVIGGPPCQEFSSLKRDEPTGYGLEMLSQYRRVVEEAKPNWWLLENVSRVPDFKVAGYSWQRFALNLAWFADCSRLRHFQFGSNSNVMLNPPIHNTERKQHGAALASDDRSFAQLKALQGLPSDFDLPSFTVDGKKCAVGNGVPIKLGEVLVSCINESVYGVTVPVAKSVTLPGGGNVTCLCGCGRVVYGRAKTASSACRKRLSRQRVQGVQPV